MVRRSLAAGPQQRNFWMVTSFIARNWDCATGIRWEIKHGHNRYCAPTDRQPLRHRPRHCGGRRRSAPATARNANAGPIEVSLEREPTSCGRAAGGRAPSHRGHSRPSDRPFGGDGQPVGLRDVRRRPPQRVGYLSQLRIAPEHRRPGRQLLRIGSICSGRRTSKAKLHRHHHPSSRATKPPAAFSKLACPALPRYQKLEEFVTFLLPVRGRLRAGRRGVEVANGSALLLPAILECPGTLRPRHQFAWHWTTTNILPPERFYVALAGSHIAGCLALWDQRAIQAGGYRGYDRTMTWRRPLLNFAWRPPAGSGRASGFTRILVTSRWTMTIPRCSLPCGCRNRGRSPGQTGLRDHWVCRAASRSASGARCYRCRDM